MAGLIDASGVALALERPPRRIVSLVPSLTETLCVLGLAESLVGVSAYCVEPHDVVRAKVRVGGQKDPDLARIRALAPDLVVANREENRREDIDALRAAAIPVWVTYPRTAIEGIRMIRELGELTATQSRAQALAEPLETLVDQVRAATAQRPPTSVFYAIWRNPYMTINADTYIHSVLAVCGGANVFADASVRYPEVTLEKVAQRRPDVILLPDEPFRFRRAHREDFAAYGDVPAVRTGRVHLVDGKLFCWYGPRLGAALGMIPKLLAGEDVAAS